MPFRCTLVGMIVTFAIGLASLPSSARAGDGAILAVFDMEDRGSGLAPETLANLTDYLAVLMAEGGYQVVPRDQIKARLRAQAADSMQACFDQSCQVELGRELAAQKTLATQIFKIGSGCRVTGTMFDLKRAATDKAAAAKAGCDEESLGLALETIAKKLAGKRVDVAKAKAEADRKAQEEAARKAKQAEDRKAQEEAARQAKQEADRQAKEEADRKIKQEADRQAKEEADRKATGEEPPAFQIADTWWHVGLKGGLVSPNLTENNGIYVVQKRLDMDRMVLDVFSGPGGMLEAYADFKLGSYFSAGLFVGYATFKSWSEYDGETRGVIGGGSELINEKAQFGYFYLGPRLAGRLPVTAVFELRLAIGLGLGLVTNSAVHLPASDNPQTEVDPNSPVNLDGGQGLATTMAIQAAWYFMDNVGLVFEVGILAQPMGKPGQGEGDISVTASPYLTFNLGIEFGG